MESVKISVVMPAWNAERYIRESLDSLVSQTLEEIELIVIDDCSIDSTASIIREYVDKDSRVNFYQNETQMGAAITRNKGMAYAKGEYIYFFDADDILACDVLLEAYTMLEFHHADIIELNMTRMSENGNVLNSCINSLNHVGLNSLRSIYDETIESINWNEWKNATSSKIYRLAFLRKNGLEFQDLSSCNDVYFSLMAMFLTNSILHLSNKEAVFVRIHGGTDRISNNRVVMNSYHAVLKIQEQLIALDLWEKAAPHFYYRAISIFRNEIRQVNSLEKVEYCNFLKETGIGVLYTNDANKQYVGMNQEIKHLYQMLLEGKYDLPLIDFYTSNQMKLLADNSITGKYLKNTNKKISVWGCGGRAWLLMSYLHESEIEIQYVFDKKEKRYVDKNGMYEVTNFDDVYSEVELIIVSTARYFEEIQAQIRERNQKCEVLNFEVLLNERK